MYQNVIVKRNSSLSVWGTFLCCSVSIIQTNKTFPVWRGNQSTADSKKEWGPIPRSLYIRSSVLILALNSQSNLKSAVLLKQYCLMQIATVKPLGFIPHPYLCSPMLYWILCQPDASQHQVGSMVSMKQSDNECRHFEDKKNTQHWNVRELHLRLLPINQVITKRGNKSNLCPYSFWIAQLFLKQQPNLS